MIYKYNISSNITRDGQQQKQNLSLTHDKDHDKTQLNLLKVHNSNLEERIRMITNEMLNKEKSLQERLDHQQKVTILYFVQRENNHGSDENSSVSGRSPLTERLKSPLSHRRIALFFFCL